MVIKHRYLMLCVNLDTNIIKLTEWGALTTCHMAIGCEVSRFSAYSVEKGRRASVIHELLTKTDEHEREAYEVWTRMNICGNVRFHIIEGSYVSCVISSTRGSYHSFIRCCFLSYPQLTSECSSYAILQDSCLSVNKVLPAVDSSIGKRRVWTTTRKEPNS